MLPTEKSQIGKEGLKVGWTTTSTYDDAEELAKESIRLQLASCAQIDGPVRSFYMWEDALESAEEYRITFKFPSSNSERFQDWLRNNHPYDVPQWVVVAASEVLSEYLDWANSSSHHNPDEVIELSRRGDELLKKKCFPEAERVFHKALEKDGTNPYVLVGLGDLYREMRKYRKAVGYYQKVLELDPANMFALRGIGDSHRGLHEDARAIPYWKLYLAQNSEDVHVITRLADSSVKTGGFLEAEEFYKKALGINERDKFALRGIGNMYYKKGDHQQALEYFEKFLRIDDRYIAVLTMTGNIYRRRREYEPAAAHYEKALKQEPKNVFALYGMGDSQRGMKNYQAAIDCWVQILEKEPSNQNLLSRVGDALAILGKGDEAESYYQKCLQINYDPFALLGLARIYRTRKQFAEAEESCKKILDKSSQDVRAIQELVEIYEAAGDLEKAEQYRDLLEG
ncbi:MAG: divalent cation tolerance protein CutA [Desulfobulbaceae bacterium]|uniref:Divalent cation tolerance protein CutA n=1 Tax=Candidatus Desulfobia pelagia TaxID=2841692 RepID=A0A8J6N8X8_9BACT|nr:divalent cation tolerance protein CutA [Candidatus Desulfobia pelagia]